MWRLHSDYCCMTENIPRTHYSRLDEGPGGSSATGSDGGPGGFFPELGEFQAVSVHSVS